MKRRRILAFSLAILFLMGVFAVPIKADTGEKKNIEPAGLNVTINSGYNGDYKIGYYCPFSITVENGYQDFSGEIQLRLPNDYITDSLYAVKADIPKGSKETYKIDVPIFNYTTRVKLSLVRGKETVYEKNLSIKPGVSADMMLLGTLSDNNESLSYFSSIYDSSGMLQPMKIIRLDEKNFPENELALQAFNGIIINDFDTGKLSKKQYEALKKSVSAGTGLLVGTGGFSAKTFGIFTDDFIKGKVGATRNISTDGLSNIAKVQQPFKIALESTELTIEGAKTIPEKSSEKLLQEISCGKGTILVGSFDLGKKEIGSWGDRANFSSEILKKLFAYRLKQQVMGNPSLGLSTPYYLENFLRNVPELPRPNFMVIIGILLGYIILAAPVTYFVLKKMDKREWMWFVAPTMGVVFAGILFIAGAGTRLNEPVVNYVDIIETGADGSATLNTFASIFSPDRRDLIVTSDNKTKMIPMLNANYDPSMNQDDKNRKIYAKVLLGTKNEIEYKENGVGTSRIVSLNGTQQVKGGLKCEINRAGGDFQGYIQNDTGMDLSGVTILFKNSFIRVEQLKAGEKKIIKEKQKKTYPDYWQMLNDVYPDPYSIKKSVATMSAEEILKIRTDFQRRQMIEGYTQGMFSGTKAKVFAFGEKKMAPTVLINGKDAKHYEKVVVVGEATVSYRKDGAVFIPTGVIPPQLKPGSINNGMNLNPDAGFLYGNGGSGEIFYEIDKDVTVTELSLSAIGVNGTSYGKPMPAGVSTGVYKAFFWDYKNEKWVEAPTGAKTYVGDEAKRFVGADNVFRVKFDGLSGEVALPQISVKGTVK